MTNKNNLALGPILEANDANSNEQDTKKASSTANTDIDNGALKLMFKIVDSMRDELIRIYNQEHPISPQTNPRGAGRKSYDVCFMFKLLLIQSYLDVSDVELLKQVKNRLDLLELLGVTPDYKFPCASTIWGYRELFAKSDIHNLFSFVSVNLLNTCRQCMAEQGISTEEVGRIASVDATYMDSYWRRDSKELNDRIKKGQESAEELYPNPNVRRQKDLEAKFSKKYGRTHFGFKVTILVDSQTRIIINIEVTPGNVHDVKVLEKVVETSAIPPEELWGDSGYMGEEYAERLQSNHGVILHTCKRKVRNGPPLTEEDKLNNRLNSAVRKNVEHCFFNHLDRKRLRLHGLCRARFSAFLNYMIANVKRACQIWLGKCVLKTAKQKQQEALDSYIPN